MDILRSVVHQKVDFNKNDRKYKHKVRTLEVENEVSDNDDYVFVVNNKLSSEIEVSAGGVMVPVVVDSGAT